jgi:uncharacterized membrane protein YhaH (DUF805 family)
MGILLFSPTGRIGPGEFMKGMTVLAVIGAVISLTGLFSFQISQILGYASVLMLVPLFFLLIKRSHDAGRSGWMSLVWFILWIVIFLIVSAIMGAVMPSGAEAELKEAVEGAMLDGAGFKDIMELGKDMGPAVAKEAAIPGAISGLVGTGIAAFLINLFNKSDDHDNQYGPQAGTS